MDEERSQPKFLTYGAVFALLLYFGAIVPWQDELAEERARLEKDRELAANPNRALALARRAEDDLEKRLVRRDATLKRLVGGLAEPAAPCPSTADAFAIVVAIAGELGIDLPDLRPLDPMGNALLAASGCSFDFESPREGDVYRLLRALEAHESHPRLRSLSLQTRTAGRGGERRIVARVVLSWPRLTPAGAKTLGVSSIPGDPPMAEDEVLGWALFEARPLPPAPPSPEGVEDTSGTTAAAATEETSAPAEEPVAVAPTEEKAPEESLTGISLEGTITIAGIDGIIASVSGKSKILQVGDELGGFVLDRVHGATATFSRGEKRIELRLDRKTLVGEPSKKEEPEAERPRLAEARPKMGLRASFVSCGRVDGGKALAGKGFRRGLLVRSVADDSLAAKLRLQDEDLIYAIDDRKIRTPTQLRQATARAGRGEPVRFRVLRRGVPMEIAHAP